MKNGLIIDEDGTKRWYKNGERHREDGPAVEKVNGYKAWYLNNKTHREDGPAIEYNGNKWWCKNGGFHRENGPAIEYADGCNYWFIEDKKIICSSQKEFLQIIKLRVFK